MTQHHDVDLGLGSMIGRRARLTPDLPALTFEGRTWTYADMLDRIDRFAAVLADGGIGRGDRVAYLGLNHPNFFVTMFAAARLGATFVPLNFRLTGPELAFIVGDAGARTLVADDQHRAVVDEIRGDIPCEQLLSSETAADGWPAMDDLLAGAEPLAEPVVVEPADVAVIMYTSGTTGRPKGAMLTHGNIAWNNVNALHAIDLAADEVALVAAPIFHIGGMNVTTILTWQKGGEVVLHRSFDPAEALRTIEERQITHMFGVPAMYLFMSQLPAFDTTDLSSVRVLVVGGAPCPEPLIRRYLDKGAPFAQGYGLTETAPMCSFLLPRDALSKVGSAGQPPLYTDVRCVDEDNRPVAAGQRGEICVKGPNVMAGYWNRPDATAEVIDGDGWFHTGDVGYFDDEGFLYVVDRVKDMVITGGENVYPAEVESVLHQHEGIADVAIVGLPDERWGEAVTAVVVPAPGAELTLEEIRDFAGSQLARYKLPTRLQLVDELPRNPSGKILKFELRDRFGD
ncbi:MAG TPA: long-chain fatty acid--CoA ligase [Acidimicrobiales bacterium]|nr:long-chain fatty acid--CoA ligase [Acidimicrobiales bacterium]